MRRLIPPFLAAILCLCLASFAGARSIAIQLNVALTSKIAEIETIYGTRPSGDTLPRLQFLQGALLYSDICYPSATARNELALGGPLDRDVFGPRPSIECSGLDQTAVNIAFVLSRAGHIEFVGPNRLALMRGDEIIMTLRLLN